MPAADRAGTDAKQGGWEEPLDAKVTPEANYQSRGHGHHVISVNRLSLRYGAGSSAVLALSDISFSVADGEFIVVVGPSGCGKSTLLKILAGLLRPTEGEASLKGTPIKGPRRDIGVVFQSPVLFPWRNVLGNVMLPVDVQQLGREGMTGRARALPNVA